MAKTKPAPEMRRCVGSKTFGIEPHDEPASNFPIQPSRKDGLGAMCKPHWSQYVKALRERSKAKPAVDPIDPKDAGKIAASVAEEDRTRPIKAARRASADHARLTSKGEPDMRGTGRVNRGRLPKVVDATEAQKAEIADLERRVKEAGGEGTDAGQAILEAAAARAAALRNGGRPAEMAVETPLGELIDAGTEEVDAAL